MQNRSAGKSTWPFRMLLGCVLMALFAWLIFRLFEPVFVWNYGWQALPTDQPTPNTQANQAWLDQAADATVWLESARSSLQAPSVSAAVAIGGERVWAGVAGYADLERSIAATLASQYRLGSSSKAVNSLALGTLLVDGRVDLDRAVSSYLPDLAEPLAAVTTRQAITHTAGVRNYGMCWCFPVWEHLNRRHYAGPIRESLRAFENDPLLFVPGKDFAYTSFGATLSGAVIEAIVEQPYLDYLQAAVFSPLGLAATAGELVEQPSPTMVTFYEVEEGRFKLAFAVDNSNKWPAGGLLSTPSEMVKLGNQLLQPTLFDAATREQLIRPEALADGRANPQGYALGWRVSAEKTLLDGELTTTTYTHHGAAVGSTSYFAVYPEFDLVVSVLMNKGQHNLSALGKQADRLVEIFIAEKLAQLRATQSPPKRR